MRIPGLGCLKGCLFTIVILFVAGWLIWELSPLQDWIGTTKGYWDQLGDWFSTVTGWIEDLGGSSGGETGGTGTG
jgi:serine/threonine-protein kinase